MSADLHCHTRLSDGSLGIDDLIVLAHNRGVDILAITDHDCLAGTIRGKIIGERHGVKVIPGVEISATDTKNNNKEVSVLCYLADSPDRLEGLCRRNLLARKKASQYMILKAAKKYNIAPELVIKCASGSTNVYKQHIMHALVECGYSTTIFGDLYNELFSPESENNIISKIEYPEPKEIIEAIHEAGGIAVLAHAGWYNNFELLENELIGLGIDGVEVWHPKNSEEDREKLIAIAKKNKLLMTGGSDFHGAYSESPTKIGDCSMPQEDFELLLKYQAKKKRLQKKAEAKQAAEK